MSGDKTPADAARLRALLTRAEDALGEGLLAIERSLAALEGVQAAGNRQRDVDDPDDERSLLYDDLSTPLSGTLAAHTGSQGGGAP